MPFILPDKAEAFIHYHNLIPCQWGEFVDKITHQRFTAKSKSHKLRRYCKHTDQRLPLAPATHLTYSIGLVYHKKG